MVRASGPSHERTGESGAFGMWPHPRGSSQISSCVLLANLVHCGATGLGGRETGAVSAPCPFNPASPPIKTPGSAALGPQLLPSEHSHDPRQLTSSRKGLAANARDKPRDMFTASGGTERTDIHMVSLGGWKGLCKSCLGPCAWRGGARPGSRVTGGD